MGVDVVDSFYKFTADAYHDIFTACIVDLYLEVASLVLRQRNIGNYARV